MNLEKVTLLAFIIGRGLLGGIGVGALAYGIFFLSLSFGNEQPFNTSSLLTVFAGAACIFISLKFKNSRVRIVESE